MKAKKIYENIDFERGKDPKIAMGLGGIIFSKEYQEIRKLMDQYDELIRKSLTGKTIFVKEALILSDRTNTGITDAKIKVKSAYSEDGGDIRVRGDLLEVNEMDTIESEQGVGHFKQQFDFYIDSTQKITFGS